MFIAWPWHACKKGCLAFDILGRPLARIEPEIQTPEKIAAGHLAAISYTEPEDFVRKGLRAILVHRNEIWPG